MQPDLPRTADGQETVELLLGDEITCCQLAYSVPLVTLRPNGIFTVPKSRAKVGRALAIITGCIF